MKITVSHDKQVDRSILKDKDNLLRLAKKAKEERKKKRKARYKKRDLTGRKVLDMVEHYLVRSSDDTHWHKVTKKLDRCEEPDGSLCMSYKFRRTCGHIKSAERWIKENAPKLDKTLEELREFIKQRGWTEYLEIIQHGFTDEQLDNLLRTWEITVHPKRKDLYHTLE